MKDMLLTYNECNRDLGYVQGMSDLLAPIYAVMQDDALAFWGFVGFMERMVNPGLQIFPSTSDSLDVGTKLPPRPVRHACPVAHARPPRPAHGPEALPPPPVGRLDKLFLLLSHAARLVQARVRLAGRAAAVGGAMDGLVE